MSTTTRDPYSVLGVQRTADADTIRKTFKKLARTYHPDVNKTPGAEERFKEVNSAYDTIGDADKRRLYDEFGEASTRPGFNAQQARAWQQQGAGGMGGFDFAGDGVDMQDLLGSLFGAGGGRGRSRRGRDVETHIEVDFMVAVLGGDRDLSLRDASGHLDNLRVKIPAGINDGAKLKLSGRGQPPPGGGPCGDLHVVIHVRPHPLLRREADDLELDVPITILEGLQGASVTVPTPTGDVKVKVPANAKSGSRLRLKGRGVQAKTPGDLYLVLRPTLPDQTDEATIEAARALEASYSSIRGSLTL